MGGAGAVEQHARGRPCPRRGAMHTHGQRPSSALRPSAPSRSCTAAAPLCTPTRALGGASGTEQHDTRRQRARRGSAAAAGQGHGARQGARGGRAHLVLLVHLPHLVVLDGKEDEALRVGGEERLELVGRDSIRGQLHGACVRAVRPTAARGGAHTRAFRTCDPCRRPALSAVLLGRRARSNYPLKCVASFRPQAESYLV